MSDNKLITFRLYENQEMPFFISDEVLIFFGLKKTTRVTLAGHLFELQEAGLLIINPNDIYRIDCRQGSAVLCLEISDRIRKKEGRLRRYHLYLMQGNPANPVTSGLSELYARLFEKFMQNGQNISCLPDSNIMRMVRYLNEHYDSGIVENGGRSNETASRLRRILSYIEEKWSEPITLKEIAQSEFLTASYLSRFLQKISLPYGMSFGIPVNYNTLHVVCKYLFRNTEKGKAMQHTDEEIFLLGIGEKLDVCRSAMMADHNKAGCFAA